jgi:hypothetical protein
MSTISGHPHAHLEVADPISNAVSDQRGDPRDKSSDTFRASISGFVLMAESDFPNTYKITDIIIRFGFQQRRLYDVTSVLAAIGCCTKLGVDSIFWHGLSHIRPTLLALQSQAGVHNCTTPLSEIIQTESMIQISRLTRGFVLCFLTLREQSLTIREIGTYLARFTGRYKSTLCKLYQVVHILQAAAIVERTIMPGQVTLVKRFYVPLDFDWSETGQSPVSIEVLLNKPKGSQDAILKRRRMEFVAEWPESGKRRCPHGPRTSLVLVNLPTQKPAHKNHF